MEGREEKRINDRDERRGEEMIQRMKETEEEEEEEEMMIHGTSWGNIAFKIQILMVFL